MENCFNIDFLQTTPVYGSYNEYEFVDICKFFLNMMDKLNNPEKICCLLAMYHFIMLNSKFLLNYENFKKALTCKVEEHLLDNDIKTINSVLQNLTGKADQAQIFLNRYKLGLSTIRN